MPENILLGGQSSFGHAVNVFYASDTEDVFFQTTAGDVACRLDDISVLGGHTEQYGGLSSNHVPCRTFLEIEGDVVMLSGIEPTHLLTVLESAQAQRPLTPAPSRQASQYRIA